MPIRPVDVQGAVQQSGSAASHQATRTHAPFAAQVQSELAEPSRAARRQETVARNLKGEAHAVGERPPDERRQRRRQGGQPRRGERTGEKNRGPDLDAAPPADGKGRVLDVRL